MCGAESLDVDTKAKEFRVRDGETVREGDVISIDGTTGEVFAGDVPVADSVVVRHFEGEKLDDDLAHAVARIMAHADGARRLRVRTNADTPEDAARARRFGAQGIGLCRTEHMFLGERRELVEKLIVAEDEAGGRTRSPRCCRCSARTSPRSSRRWTACRSRSGCSTRRCTSSCPTSPS